MNPNSPTPQSGLKLSTPTDTTLVLTRTFNAPRKLVCEAFFTPEKMRRWMLPPPGWELVTCECDPRVAGALRLVWKSAEANPAMTLCGVFTEASAPSRFVHTELMLLGDGQPIGAQVETHEFTEVGGVTTMKITQVYSCKEARDGAMGSGMDEGMEACYRNLDAELAKRP